MCNSEIEYRGTRFSWSKWERGATPSEQKRASRMSARHVSRLISQDGGPNPECLRAEMSYYWTRRAEGYSLPDNEIIEIVDKVGSQYDSD